MAPTAPAEGPGEEGERQVEAPAGLAEDGDGAEEMDPIRSCPRRRC